MSSAFKLSEKALYKLFIIIIIIIIIIFISLLLNYTDYTYALASRRENDCGMVVRPLRGQDRMSFTTLPHWLSPFVRVAAAVITTNTNIFETEKDTERWNKPTI